MGPPACEFLHSVAILIEPVEFPGRTLRLFFLIVTEDGFLAQLGLAPDVELVFVVQCRAEFSSKRNLRHVPPICEALTSVKASIF